MKRRAIEKGRRQSALEHGVNLDVLGQALIAQADERIKWHEHVAAIMADELQTLSTESKERWRRTDLETKMTSHQEYAKFLAFVRDSIVATRRYRLGLYDLSALEIRPKGMY
jgi:hypothetical protein